MVRFLASDDNMMIDSNSSPALAYDDGDGERCIVTRQDVAKR